MIFCLNMLLSAVPTFSIVSEEISTIIFDVQYFFRTIIIYIGPFIKWNHEQYLHVSDMILFLLGIRIFLSLCKSGWSQCNEFDQGEENASCHYNASSRWSCCHVQNSSLSHWAGAEQNIRGNKNTSECNQRHAALFTRWYGLAAKQLITIFKDGDRDDVDD